MGGLYTFCRRLALPSWAWETLAVQERIPSRSTVWLPFRDQPFMASWSPIWDNFRGQLGFKDLIALSKDSKLTEETKR